MGFFDKIMFWKKKEEPILEKAGEGLPPLGDDLGTPPGMEEPMGMEHISPDVPEKPAVPLGSPMPEVAAVPPAGGREIELVLAKLDAVKARLDSMDTRLMHIEKLAEES